MREVVLAVDLGAGSLRVGAVTATARVVAGAAVPLAGQEPAPGWSEIDPELWWRALASACGTVLDRLSPDDRVGGVCCGGLTRSQVFLNRDARSLRPALLFRDRRAVAEAGAAASSYATTNPADAITAFHPLARLLWLAAQEPENFTRLRAVADPKDYLNLRLTGRLAADEVTLSRLASLDRAEVSSALHRRCLELLRPDGSAPWAMVGPIVAREPPFDRLHGIPVFAGAMDAWAAAVGAGAVRPGQGYDIAGTSEVVGVLTTKPTSAPGLVALAWGDGVHQIGGPTQLGADGAAWAHATFRSGGRLAAAVNRVAARVPDEGLPVFIPYLAGERAPLWRDDVAGLVHGVGRGHGSDDLFWAALEGVAQAVRDIVSLATAASGEPVYEIRACGGGARADGWCQLKANVLGLPVLRARERETGLIGAAMAAWIGLGRFPNLAAAATRMCIVKRRFEPRPELRSFFERRAARYQRAKAAALALADEARG